MERPRVGAGCGQVCNRRPLSQAHGSSRWGEPAQHWEDEADLPATQPIQRTGWGTDKRNSLKRETLNEWRRKKKVFNVFCVCVCQACWRQCRPRMAMEMEEWWLTLLESSSQGPTATVTPCIVGQVCGEKKQKSVKYIGANKNVLTPGVDSSTCSVRELRCNQ